MPATALVLAGSPPAHRHGCSPDALNRQQTWNRHATALERFARREGHCHVPYRHSVDGLALYRWAAKQRTRYDRLTLAQRRRLERIPGWHWNFRDAAWEQAFALLRAFTEREGHARVTRSHVEQGFGLGRWVAGQRIRRLSMPVRHRELLDALDGWVWEARLDNWGARLQMVTDYAQANGHARVPFGLVYEGCNLGAWVARQRSAFRSGRLTPERAKALAAIPGWAWTLSGHE